MSTIRKYHPMAVLPLIVLCSMIIWQAISLNYYLSELPDLNEILLIAISMVLTFAALFFRNARGEFTSYLEGLINPLRQHMIIISCILMGGVHFMSILGKEPVYAQMGFMVLILAFYETSSVAIDFYKHYSYGLVDATRDTVQRHMVNMAGKLGMAFALSAIMLYLSFLVIVGFTGPFSVAFLAALMILAIAFMTMVRRL